MWTVSRLIWLIEIEKTLDDKNCRIFVFNNNSVCFRCEIMFDHFLHFCDSNIDRNIENCWNDEVEKYDEWIMKSWFVEREKNESFCRAKRVILKTENLLLISQMSNEDSRRRRQRRNFVCDEKLIRIAVFSKNWYLTFNMTKLARFAIDAWMTLKIVYIDCWYLNWRKCNYWFVLFFRKFDITLLLLRRRKRQVRSIKTSSSNWNNKIDHCCEEKIDEIKRQTTNWIN